MPQNVSPSSQSPSTPSSALTNTLSSPTDVGNLFLESDPKKLAKIVDLAGKVSTEMIGINYPVLTKLVPFFTKTYKNKADFQSAAANFDQSTFSRYPWELAGPVNNMIATGIAGVGASDALMQMRATDLLANSVSRGISEHIAAHSGPSKILTGIWTGQPFLSPFGVNTLRNVTSGSEFRKLMKDITTAAIDGAPSGTDAVTQIEKLLTKNLPEKGVFFNNPQYNPEQLKQFLTTPPQYASVLRNASKFLKPVAANLMPLAPIVLDSVALEKNWQTYHNSNSQEASRWALASVLSSGLSLSGSVFSAASLNTYSAIKVPKVTGRLGIGLMVAGTLGSIYADMRASNAASNLNRH